MPPTTLRSDDPWNLRPYDVPWGDDYYDYEPGKLPGHDGMCLVLRSPTPVEQKRTAVACKHCRQRKAKCSGDRPACSRCADRGRRCVYPDPEDRPSQPADRPQRPARALRRSSGSDTSSSSSSSDSCFGTAHRLKAEPDFDAGVPSLLYDMHGACKAGSPDSGYASPPSTTYSDIEEYHYPYARYLPDTSGQYTPPPAQMSPAIYAPTPVRPAAPPAETYVPRSALAHVAVGPAEYGYQDLSALRAAEAVSHHDVFAEAAAGPRLDMAITEPSDIAVAPAFAYTAHGAHAYSTHQEPVPVASADHAQSASQYHPAQDYAPASWYGEQNMYYVVPRQPYQAYTDQVSYTHAVY